jgi:hypothetical protein
VYLARLLEISAILELIITAIVILLTPYGKGRIVRGPDHLQARSQRIVHGNAST